MYTRRRIAAVALLAAACSGAQPLEAAAIDTAEQRWRDYQLRDYRMELTVEGDRIDSGDFRAEVRGGALVSVERNGEAVSSRDPFYTVPGLYAFMRDELEMAASPERFWGVPPGTAVRQRAQFHREHGYPQRYLRAVSGTQHNVAVQVKRLEPSK